MRVRPPVDSRGHAAGGEPGLPRPVRRRPCPRPRVRAAGPTHVSPSPPRRGSGAAPPRGPLVGGSPCRPAVATAPSSRSMSRELAAVKRPWGGVSTTTRSAVRGKPCLDAHAVPRSGEIQILQSTMPSRRPKARAARVPETASSKPASRGRRRSSCQRRRRAYLTTPPAAASSAAIAAGRLPSRAMNWSSRAETRRASSPRRPATIRLAVPPGASSSSRDRHQMRVVLR